MSVSGGLVVGTPLRAFPTESGVRKASTGSRKYIGRGLRFDHCCLGEKVSDPAARDRTPKRRKSVAARRGRARLMGGCRELWRVRLRGRLRPAQNAEEHHNVPSILAADSAEQAAVRLSFVRYLRLAWSSRWGSVLWFMGQADEGSAQSPKSEVREAQATPLVAPATVPPKTAAQAEKQPAAGRPVIIARPPVIQFAQPGVQIRRFRGRIGPDGILAASEGNLNYALFPNNRELVRRLEQAEKLITDERLADAFDVLDAILGEKQDYLLSAQSRRAESPQHQDARAAADRRAAGQGN